MALSQVQCLDDSHINLRTNESKPEFFYSEEQRLALETLLRDGRDAFEDYVKTNGIRHFLSDVELERILGTVEVYCTDYKAELCGESDGEEVSLQYWPDRSDRSIPLLDIGWPGRASYRGVTRVQVYTQPPYEGQSHIKEVVRKMIAQAQKVIAVVMDLFTDVDIFKDLLDASYRRKVPVYIMLETTGVKHFLRMCEKAGMHTGHLKNLRVRSIRGAGFFSRSSKILCGSQNQKFMFIDGDKAVSGSYSFTWSASRLDRNLITVLTGQAVDIFDTLFQDLYVMSNGVCLSKMNVSSEPEPEFIPQMAPTPLMSATMALKLINPKYSLVSSCAFTTNGPVSDQTCAKNSASKNQAEVIKQTSENQAIHPGLLNLEKVNMINYVPTWPDPDPPSDVIGFINIRDYNKPLQAHLMRSELFEVSQAIRFKDPIHEPKETVSLRAEHISQTPSGPEPPSEKHTTGEVEKELVTCMEKPETVLTCKTVDKGELCVMEKEPDSTTLQSKSIHKEKDSPSAVDETVSDTKKTLDTPRLLETTGNLDLKSSAVAYKSHRDSFAILDTPSVEQCGDGQVTVDVLTTQDHRNPKSDMNQDSYNATQMSNCDSSISSMSDEYYECFSPVADIYITEKTEESLDNSTKTVHREQEVPHSYSSSAQDYTDLDNKQAMFTAKVLKTSCSIVFNFSSAEFKSTTAHSKATFALECDKISKINDSLLSVNESKPCRFSQTPNGFLNCSSTSEEYFECSDTMGLNSEMDGEVYEFPSSLENDSLTKPSQILKAETLSDQSCKNEKDEFKVDSVQHTEEILAGSHLVADELAMVAVLGSEENTRTLLDEKFHRHQIVKTDVMSESEVEHESMVNFLQEHEISASQEVLEIQTRAESVELAGNVEKTAMQDLQLDECLDLIWEKPVKEPLQSDTSLELICEGKIPEKNSSLELQDIESETSRVVNVWDSVYAEKHEGSHDLISEGQTVRLAMLAFKPSLQNPQYEQSPDVLLKPIEAVLKVSTGSESMRSMLHENTEVTRVIPGKREITSAALTESEEVQNPLTDFDCGSNQVDFSSKELVNEHRGLQDEEAHPAVLPIHSPCEKPPKPLKTIELLILEDSNPQESQLKHNDPIRPITAMDEETKLSKTETIEANTTNDRELGENNLGHEVSSLNRRETSHPTALVEKKQEREHICMNQMNKNVPEAKSELVHLVRKQPHQASSRIPIQARRELTTSKIDTIYRSFGLKAGLHRYPHGKPPDKCKPRTTSFPSPEKLSTGRITPVRSTQIPQRHPWTFPATDGTSSPPKQLIAPRIRQSDQPSISRKRSASITKYNNTSSGISCSGQVKKQPFKG